MLIFVPVVCYAIPSLCMQAKEKSTNVLEAVGKKDFNDLKSHHMTLVPLMQILYVTHFHETIHRRKSILIILYSGCGQLKAMPLKVTDTTQNIRTSLLRIYTMCSALNLCLLCTHFLNLRTRFYNALRPHGIFYAVLFPIYFRLA